MNNLIASIVLALVLAIGGGVLMYQVVVETEEVTTQTSQVVTTTGTDTVGSINDDRDDDDDAKEDEDDDDDRASSVVTPPTTPTAPATGGGSQPSTTKTYTLAEIATHKNAGSCWTAVNGLVYDVTPFINQHPGGAARILSLCGKDGSSAFTGQHAGEPKPETTLASFKIGTLK